MPTRNEMILGVQQDYPHLPLDWVELVLDLWEKDRPFIENICKEERKKNKGKSPEIKRQLTIEEFERLHSKFQEPNEQKVELTEGL